MKKIDSMVLRAFIGPFILIFFITLFIIVMQFLWKYIDDMVGKGLEWYLVLELIFYASASFVPLALPLAILVASIMTFGNLGERYELVAIKSGGVSLLRFMRSLIIASIILSGLAFYFANNVLPVANLKFSSLLYDIRKQKPAFNIREGVFYNGIEGFSIRVGSKGSDDRTIYDVMIYDLSSGRGNDHVLLADSGEMYTTEDEMYLVLRLYDGVEYREMRSSGPEPEYEHITNHFKEWQKAFDLSDFSMTRTDENLWSDHHRMLNIGQLKTAMDTMIIERTERLARMKDYIHPYLYFLAQDPDSLSYLFYGKSPPEVFSGWNGLEEDERTKTMQIALNNARNVKSFVGVSQRDVSYNAINYRKHEIELYRKFAVSIACLVLFFIGAPLGSIIRKGGFGMPMLLSIILFVFYHVLSMTGEKLAEKFVFNSIIGMGLPIFSLLPFGIWLTYKANKDSGLFNKEKYYKWILYLYSFVRIFKRFN
ncbi:MAG: YjgP/YjgQ family permease [Chitinophagaceae bacterium]|nr:MAG: YjgP/YjgQ family permease [Chitinophagaceae bacterium]